MEALVTPLSCDGGLIWSMLLREMGNLLNQRDGLRWLNNGRIDEGNQSRVEKYGYVFRAVRRVEMARYGLYRRVKSVRGREIWVCFHAVRRVEMTRYGSYRRVKSVRGREIRVCFSRSETGRDDSISIVLKSQIGQIVPI